MTFLKHYIVFLIFLISTGVSADTLTALQCQKLFSETKSSIVNSREIKPLQTIESELRESVGKLAVITKEFYDLPPMPYSYLGNEYPTLPRVVWALNRSSDIRFGHYGKVYQLELEASQIRTQDRSKSSQLYLELANLYAAEQNAKAAILSALRAGRSDLAEWIATTLEYPLPQYSDLSTPRNNLSDYIHTLRTERGFIRKELSELVKVAQESHWDELEVQARRMKKSSNPLEQAEGLKIYQQLGENYLKHLMYQEAIWAFRKAGNLTKSTELQNHLQHVLLNNPMKLTDMEVGGVTNSKIYEFAPGVRAIVKFRTGLTKGNQKPKDEFLVYKISELLGMDRISTTVLRKIGLRTASMQVLVRKRGGKPQWITESKEEMRAIFSTMDVFDYLIVNQDRHNDVGAHNQFFRFGQEQVLIDHGISFRPYFIIRHLPILKNLYQNTDVINDKEYSLSVRMPSPEFIKALEDLDRPEQNKKLQALFTGGLLSLNYQIFEHRRKTVLNEIRKIRKINP